MYEMFLDDLCEYSKDSEQVGNKCETDRLERELELLKMPRTKETPSDNQDKHSQEETKEQEIRETDSVEPLGDLCQSDRDYEDLMKTLEEFIEENTVKNCAQRSAEWYKMRQFSFGGSEIADLMGVCKKKYRTQEEFLAEKYQAENGTGRGIDPKKQIIMDWGTFFEPMHRQVIEQLFGVSIHETSMCPAKGILEGSHESPDGLTVVRTRDFLRHVSCNDIVDKSIFNKEYLTILIEQKCPYYRKPVKEIVPEHYIGQIKLGLGVFNICDVGCFSDSLIRLCTHRQLFTKTYNSGILKQTRPETPDPDPEYIGFVAFSEKSQELLGFQPGDVSGDMTDEKFAQMMDLLRGGELDTQNTIIRYDPSDLESTKKQVYGLAKEFGRDGVSFICWKMVGLTFTAVERSRGFESILSIFISLGKKVLARYTSEKTPPLNELDEIKCFSAFVEKLAMPLTAGNHEDSWFKRYEKEIIDQFEKYFMDDWQSFYVLLSLMVGANDPGMNDRADGYVLKARDLCKDDPVKCKLLQTLIDEINQDSEVAVLEQPIQELQCVEEPMSID